MKIETIYPDTNDVFLVTGGGRGITAQCAIRLAERYGGTYILIGRSPLEATEPAWATGCDDEAALKAHAIATMQADGARPKPAEVQRAVDRVLAQREIHGTLRAIEAVGGAATYLSVDVTDGNALQAALAPLRDRITGVLHGAGVLADKRIEQKKAADFDRVYGTKVRGLQAVLACIPPEQLRYLVLFSSVAGFYGNAGQADYALANEVLNKLAHRLQREYPACHVVAVDWGPWDGGMVTPELKRLFSERHVALIPVDVGTAMLADELAQQSRAAQIVVGGALLPSIREPSADLRSYRLHRALTLDANPFLRDHVIGGKAVLPTVCAIGWMINAAENLYPGYTFACVEDYRVLKGIVFDETLADDYILDLHETAKSVAELHFDALISSEANGKSRYHYKARITLRSMTNGEWQMANGEPTNHESRITNDESRMTSHVISGEALYHDQTLFHGPSFRGVEEVLTLDERGLTLRCRLPDVPLETQGQFTVQTFNPYLTDVQLQSLLIWVKKMRGIVGLPLRIQKGEQFRKVHFGEVTYTTLTVQTVNDHSLVADVVVYNERGDLCSRVTGAEITLSKRLLGLFAQNKLGVKSKGQ
ncbi:MAG TPA: SDR family NAD(P)-dependent oxidoreductase [Anaerolineae bacterium]|nr:SDR family NAD(P)-dependent oxidoreductase [Anaerolineae bacterium]HQK14408.1 SDR family NAD(P)-dependent oxidoreductase [Anaerolineae bacterium]